MVDTPSEARRFRGAIFAATRDWIVGVDGALAWHYPEDLKRFKRLTLGTTIVMGRKTFDSIGAKPLPGRRNIVLSRSIAPSENVEVVDDFAALSTLIENDDVWFIGGAQLLDCAIDSLDLIDITFVAAIEPIGEITRISDLDALGWCPSTPVINPMDSRLTHVRYFPPSA